MPPCPPPPYTRRVKAAEILPRLAELSLPNGDYALHSSASLVLRGILEEAGDLDIVARGAAWDQALSLVAAGKAVLDEGRQDSRVSVGEDVEIYDGWLGENADTLVDRAESVLGVPCVPLEDVIAVKEKLDRPKDREHLARIQEHLMRTREHRG